MDNVRLVVGCNYHTTWQSDKSMRFVLKEVIGDKAVLTTRTTKKEFKTNVCDLIFIETDHNKRKADDIEYNKTLRDNAPRLLKALNGILDVDELDSVAVFKAQQEACVAVLKATGKL